MKKIMQNEELLECMEKAIDLLCGTVKKTLGPIGDNVIIDHSSFSPFITNDGVTIAKNIESEEESINTILELAKEASIKTDEEVGDGTTTTLVFLEALFKDGLALIKKGKKPIILKQELEKALDKVIQELEKKKKKPTQKDLFHIAVCSSNDLNIGRIVCDTMKKVKQKSAITLKDTEALQTTVKFYKGYRFETFLASDYYLKLEPQIKLNQALLLAIDNTIENMEEIALILNEAMDEDTPLVIIANDYSEEFVNNILSLYLDNQIKIYLFKNPFYGETQRVFLEDISLIANSEILMQPNTLNIKHFGKIEYIEINKEYTNLSFSINETIKKHIENVKREKKKTEEKDFLNKRIAMFQNGFAEIHIGGITKTEIREKHMRYQDALCAIDVATKGIVPGSGLSLLEMKENYIPKTDGEKILANALDKPFFQILENAGLETSTILSKIKEENYNILYNVSKNTYEKIENASIIDPIEVLKKSLENATSIASMLLTTSSLVINEYKSTLNKEQEYNDL